MSNAARACEPEVCWPRSTSPALVIHGAADRLCDVSGGRATAAAIPGAELWIVDGMGHDLPRALWPELARRIAAVVARSEAQLGQAPIVAK